MNGSWVIAKMAGTESTAKIISATLTSTRATNNGVANQTSLLLPFGSGPLIQNLFPSILGVRFMCLRIQFSSGFLSMSVAPSSVNSILTPVKSRKAPKNHKIQENWLTKAAPRPIKIPRSTNAAKIPQTRTRY